MPRKILKSSEQWVTNEIRDYKEELKKGLKVEGGTSSLVSDFIRAHTGALYSDSHMKKVVPGPWQSPDKRSVKVIPAEADIFYGLDGSI